MGQLIRGVGRLLGSAAGSVIPGIGTTAGGLGGHHVGAAMSRWMGQGDYTVSKNSLISQTPNGTIPSMHSNNQTFTIRHREFIATIRGSTAFTVQETFVVNPGLSGTFPWLSGLARKFEQYTIKGMIYHYVPTSGTYSSAGTALGAVMIQTTYRATDASPSSKVEMLNEYWATETVPSNALVHPIECDPKENPFSIHYVRSQEPVGEPLMYDLAKTFVATQGMTTNDIVGDLWVTYEIELKKPIVSSNVNPEAAFYAALFPHPSTTTLFAGPALSSYGSAPAAFNGRSIIVFPGARRDFSFTLRIVFDTTFSALGHAIAALPTYTNCTPAEYATVSALGFACSGINPVTDGIQYTVNFSVPDSDAIPAGQDSVVELPPITGSPTINGNSRVYVTMVTIV